MSTYPKSLMQAIDSFGLTGEPIPLAGGQNLSVKVGEAVLKPVDDLSHYEWLLSILDEVQPTGYRLSKPLRTASGAFVGHGWMASLFEPGRECDGRIKDKLETARMFHKDLAPFGTEDMDAANHRWARAHRVAWQESELPHPLPDQVHSILAGLLRHLEPKNYPRQLVHGDLSGNILFHETLSPLVIDFSPTVAPVEYAEAILVCDCIAWQRSPLEEINLLPKSEFYKEMMLRAIVFRLSVEVFCDSLNTQSFRKQYMLFKPILDYLGY